MLATEKILGKSGYLLDASSKAVQKTGRFYGFVILDDTVISTLQRTVVGPTETAKGATNVLGEDHYNFAGKTLEIVMPPVMAGGEFAFFNKIKLTSGKVYLFNFE